MDVLGSDESVLEEVTTTRQVETVTFIKGHSEGEHLDGVLVEITDADGRIAEIALFSAPWRLSKWRSDGWPARWPRAHSRTHRLAQARVGRPHGPFGASAHGCPDRDRPVRPTDGSCAGAKQPTATGSGGAAATVDVARDAGRDRHAAPRRQRGRRGGRGGRRARRDRAVLVRHRRRRLHGHPHARTGRSPRSTSARRRRPR